MGGIQPKYYLCKQQVSQMAACLIRGCLSEEDTSSVFAYSLRDQRLAVILQFPLQQKLEWFDHLSQQGRCHST